MRYALIFLLFAAVGAAQNAHIMVLVPSSDDTTTGELRFRDLRSRSTNYGTLQVDKTSGTTAGVLEWIGGDGNGIFSIEPQTGNYYGGLWLSSGGGGGSGDHAVIIFRSGTTPKWYITGVWNGATTFDVRDPDASYASRLSIAKTTGMVTIGDLTITGGCTGCSGSSGHFLPGTDAIYDIGEDTTPLRWRNLYLSGSTVTQGVTAAAANLYAIGSTAIPWASVSTTNLTIVDADYNSFWSWQNPSAAGQYIRLFDAGGTKVVEFSQATGRMELGSAYSLMPGSSVGQFGANALRWDVYANTINSGNVDAYNVKPRTDNSYDLGSIALRYANAYMVNMTVSGACTGCGPSNMVTTDTTQTISGAKTLTAASTYVNNLYPNSAGVSGLGTVSVPFLHVAAKQLTIVDTDYNSSWSWQNPSAAGQYIRLFDAGGTKVVEFSQATGRMELGSAYSLMPGSSVGQFGANALRWDVYANTINSGNVDAYNVKPRTDNSYDLGSSILRYANAYAMNMTVSSILTVSSAIAANGGISTGSATNSTIYMGSGNLFIRTFSGADFTCSTANDGLFGFRSDTNELQICNGATLKKVSML